MLVPVPAASERLLEQHHSCPETELYGYLLHSETGGTALDVPASRSGVRSSGRIR